MTNEKKMCIQKFQRPFSITVVVIMLIIVMVAKLLLPENFKMLGSMALKKIQNYSILELMTRQCLETLTLSFCATLRTKIYGKSF